MLSLAAVDETSYRIVFQYCQEMTMNYHCQYRRYTVQNVVTNVITMRRNLNNVGT